MMLGHRKWVGSQKGFVRWRKTNKKIQWQSNSHIEPIKRHNWRVIQNRIYHRWRLTLGLKNQKKKFQVLINVEPKWMKKRFYQKSVQAMHSFHSHQSKIKRAGARVIKNKERVAMVSYRSRKKNQPISAILILKVCLEVIINCTLQKLIISWNIQWKSPAASIVNYNKNNQS